MSGLFRTHEVFNQVAPLTGVNLFASDPALAALVDAAPHAVAEQLSQHGAFAGSPEAGELGRLANEHPPVLKTHDASGARIDMVEYHPAYHALMRRSVAAGLHCSVWDATGGEGSVRTVARAARLYLSAQIDAGHLSAMSMTNAAVAALAQAPDLAEEWLPLIRSRRYDSTAKPATQKVGATINMGFAEKQGGTDLRAATTRAERGDSGTYRLTGHKWFVSAPMSDAMVALAQSLEGLSAFLVPRYLPDGKRNPVRLMRLKDKLGTRACASAEVEMEGATGWMIGEPGQGLATVMEMMTLARLDSAVIAAAQMRLALSEAVHHARHRRGIGGTLIDQAMMTRVLADMGLDSVAATALAFRVAEAFDRANDDPAEAAFARLMTPVAKYWVAKMAPALTAEAMEAVGGNAFIEDSRLARLYRDAPAQMIWDAPGNVLCLDVLRVLRKSSDALELVLAVSENALGVGAKTTLNVLRAATAVALADEGSARILTEQLAMTVAAASLRRSFPAVIADAFIETRLNKPWRTTYGMLDSRFDGRAFLDYICPAE
jgi:putative acyl-CoA dehydrogenase